MMAPGYAMATGGIEHAFAPDHVKQKGEANGPEKHKAKDHDGDPGAFALIVKPGFAAGKPARMARMARMGGGWDSFGHRGHC
jgi:hypothetical protein